MGSPKSYLFTDTYKYDKIKVVEQKHMFCLKQNSHVDYLE